MEEHVKVIHSQVKRQKLREQFDKKLKCMEEGWSDVNKIQVMKSEEKAEK